MLSGETSVGNYVVEAVKVMDSIIGVGTSNKETKLRVWVDLPTS